MVVIVTGVLLGVLFAKYLNRAVILPDLQLDDTSVVPAPYLYDIKSLEDVMNKHNISMQMPVYPLADASVQVASCENMDELSSLCMEKIKGHFHKVKDIVFECPYPHPSVAPSFVLGKRDLYWDLVLALMPSTKLQRMMKEVVNAISETFNTSKYGFVQGSYTTLDLHNSLKYNGFDSGLNLILSGPASNLVERNGSQALTLEEFGLPMGDLSQPERDLISFYTGLDSEQTLSEPDTTFGALLLLERREKLAYAAEYPRASSMILPRVPLLKLPWVLFHNTEDKNMEYMLKAAVKSGVSSKCLIPFCVLSGPQSDINTWLAVNNITVISHNPPWVSEYFEKEGIVRKKAAQFKFDKGVEEISMGNAMQIEIPNIMKLRQFQYVLYATPSVLFRQRVTLKSFGQELPKVVKCISGPTDNFPFESTIVLWNVSAGVSNYENMVQFVNNPHRKREPLVFAVDEQKWTLSKSQLRWVSPWRLAVRSVEGYDPNPAIVDFSGMSPHNFVHTVRKGTCPDNICLEGIFRGWCHYIFEWSTFLEIDDTEAGIHVMKECVRRLCGLRGGCRAWKSAISRMY